MSAFHIVFATASFCSCCGEKSGHEVLGLSPLCQTETWELESCVLQLLEICFDVFPCFLMVYKDTYREYLPRKLGSLVIPHNSS